LQKLDLWIIKPVGSLYSDHFIALRQQYSTLWYSGTPPIKARFFSQILMYPVTPATCSRSGPVLQGVHVPKMRTAALCKRSRSDNCITWIIKPVYASILKQAARRPHLEFATSCPYVQLNQICWLILKILVYLNS
jgi:hypothetical protein